MLFPPARMRGGCVLLYLHYERHLRPVSMRLQSRLLPAAGVGVYSQSGWELSGTLVSSIREMVVWCAMVVGPESPFLRPGASA
jgi:hypothetical protein